MLGILWAVLWGIVICALVSSDGVCHQDCKICPYAGDCPQERKEENKEKT